MHVLPYSATYVGLSIKDVGLIVEIPSFKAAVSVWSTEP